MVLPSGRTARALTLAPLLVLLLMRAAAVAQFSAEKAYRAARAVADADDLPKAQKMAEEAIARAGALDDAWVWTLKMFHAEIVIKQKGSTAPAPPLLPPQYATTEAAVIRHLALGYQYRDDAHFAEAERIAGKHQPQLLLYVHLARINLAEDYEQHARKALALAKNKPLFVAHAWNALTYRRMQGRRYVDAVEAGERAMALYRRLGASGRIATGAGNLGWAYIEVGNYDLAEDLFRQAEAAAVSTNRPEYRSRWLNQLGNVFLAREDLASAETYYQQALTIAGENPGYLTNIARVQVERGNYDAAAQSLRVPLQAKDASARILDARIDIARNQFARGEKTLREVIGEESASQTKWTAQSHLALLFARMQRNREAEQKFLEAIDTARDVRASIKDAELSISFYNTARHVFDGYVNFLVRANRKEDALKATELIREEQSELRRKIDARAFAKQTGATILCYWLGRDGSHAWRVTANDVTHALLPAEKRIADAVRVYRAEQAKQRPTSLKQRGRELYDMLVAPVAKPFAKDARVVIVADGALHALNFETLVPPATPQHYWIEDVILTSAGSLQSPAPRKAASDARILLVGDPIPAAKEFPKLTHAANEIKTVASHFPTAVVLQGAKATTTAYKAASPEKFDYLHFAAHGEAARKRPLDSAVILSPDRVNGFRLSARDIAEHKLNARLVMISSCYGAGDRTFAGEGLVGLAWAFSSAGADQVIAALTTVDDSIAPQLVDEMYRRIRRNEDPARALRDAKLKLIRRGGAAGTPRYWAPFVLYSGS